MDNLLNSAAQSLHLDWGLELPQIISEEAILQQLAKRVVDYLERGTEAFFQLMYRLDIPEQKLRAALLEADAPYSVARLIYDRQIQKTKARMEHRNAAASDDPELKW